MWIDTHCHLDASEFDSESATVAMGAKEKGVSWIVIPAVAKFDFDTVQTLSHEQPNCVYALGIHPIFVPKAEESDLAYLRERVADALNDKRFVGIGEIGLDYFIPALK
jgi:TatD DNase family protein